MTHQWILPPKTAQEPRPYFPDVFDFEPELMEEGLFGVSARMVFAVPIDAVQDASKIEWDRIEGVLLPPEDHPEANGPGEVMTPKMVEFVLSSCLDELCKWADERALQLRWGTA